VSNIDRRRTRLNAYVISPLPLAVGLMTAGSPADAATVQTVSASTRADLSSASLYPGFVKKGTGYAMQGLISAPQANGVACAVVNDAYTTQAQVAVSGDVRDNDGPAGNSAAVASFTQGAHGAVSMDVLADSSNGSFVYTPDAGFSGTDNFTYTVVPNPSSCIVVNSTATVAITVSPVATTDSFAGVVGNGPVPGNVLTNDVGNDLTVIGNTQPAHGSANVAADGSFLYFPQPSFTGTDSFQYTIQDGSGGQSTSTVTLRVTAAAVVTATPAASTGALGLLASLLAWFGLRRRREH